MINYKTVYKSNEGRDAVLKAYDEILSNRPLAYEEMWLNTSYVKSFTIQCGKKELPPLILLHGTNSNSSMWIGDVSEYTKLLARSFNLRREPVSIFTDEELKRLTMPLLLFAGREDVLLKSEKTAKRLNALVPGAVINLLPDHGHVLVGFSSEIVNFLN